MLLPWRLATVSTCSGVGGLTLARYSSALMVGLAILARCAMRIGLGTNALLACVHTDHAVHPVTMPPQYVRQGDATSTGWVLTAASVPHTSLHPTITVPIVSRHTLARSATNLAPAGRMVSPTRLDQTALVTATVVKRGGLEMTAKIATRYTLGSTAKRAAADKGGPRASQGCTAMATVLVAMFIGLGMTVTIATRSSLASTVTPHAPACTVQ